jgi:Flp pilus assembly pilin Flp
LRTEDRGQDLSEYCLLTALVALVALGIIIHVAGGFQAIWGSANTTLANGNTATEAPATGSPATASTPAGH